MECEGLFESRIRELMVRRPAARLRQARDRVSDAPRDALRDEPRHHVTGRHEFTFVVSGRSLVRTPGEDVLLQPGDLLLISPGLDHAERPVELSDSYVMFWCELDHQCAVLGHTTYAQGGYAASTGLQLHGPTNVQSVAAAIASELEARAWGWSRSVQALLQYLGCILIRRLRRGQALRVSPPESPALADDPRQWEAVQQAIAYCRANFARGLRVEEVAQAVGYSASRLSHLFAAQRGESVADHLRGLRLARARDLLESTDHTIADIAVRVGYSDPAHFTRAFVRAFRISPQTFRRRLRGQ